MRKPFNVFVGAAVAASSSVASAEPPRHVEVVHRDEHREVVVDHRGRGPVVVEHGHGPVVVEHGHGPVVVHRDEHREVVVGPGVHRDVVVGGGEHRDVIVHDRGEIRAGVDVHVIDRGHGGEVVRVAAIERPHREWRVDRPVISGYWRPRAHWGSTVVIRGHNFVPGVGVMWGGVLIPGAVVTGDSVTFVVPPGHLEGGLMLHGPGLDVDYPLGTFAGADPNVDLDAEARNEDAARQARAEAAWRARQAQIANDDAARESAFEAEEAQLDATREQRREQRIADIRAKWHADFLAAPDTEAELALHEERVAMLDRMLRLAERANDGKLGVRVAADTDRENARHDQRMAALQASFGAP
jgi:hypothetical protein